MCAVCVCVCAFCVHIMCVYVSQCSALLMSVLSIQLRAYRMHSWGGEAPSASRKHVTSILLWAVVVELKSLTAVYA